jgi:DNA-directed RNA polymerase specialized sigma24 family protein
MMRRDLTATHSKTSSQGDGPLDLDVDALAIKLLGFVRRRATRLQLVFGRRGTGLPKGQDLEDIVAESLASLYGGGRRWDRGKYPDPWGHLVLTAKGLLWNLFNSKDLQLTESRPLEELPDKEDKKGTLETALVYQDRKNKIYARLVDLVGADSQLVKVHDLIHEGYKPSEMAVKLGVSTQEVNNLKKRYWRFVKEIASSLDRDEA